MKADVIAHFNNYVTQLSVTKQFISKCSQLTLSVAHLSPLSSAGLNYLVFEDARKMLNEAFNLKLNDIYHIYNSIFEYIILS